VEGNEKVVVRPICKNCVDWVRINHLNGRCGITNKRSDRNHSCKDWSGSHEAVSGTSETNVEGAADGR
jgi:hypothetical protein